MSSSITGSKGFYGWVNLATTAVVGIMGGFYLVSFGIFLPFLVKDFGWNRGTASFAATINMVALGVCGPLAGMFIMKYGARRSILMGNILGFLGFLLLFFHTQLWQLFLGYGVLIGTAAGFGGLLACTTVLNNWFVEKRSWVLGIYLGAGGAVGMVTGPAMMALITHKGWRTTYLAISILVVLFAVVLPALLIKNKPQDLGQVPDGPGSSKTSSVSAPAPRRAGYKTPVDFTAKQARRTATLWLLIAYFCMNMFAMGAIMTHLVAYLFDIRMSAWVAGAAGSVMAGFMTGGQFGAGYLGMRFSMLSIAVSGEVLKVLGIGILISAASVPVVFLSMVVLGIGFGFAMVATMNIFPNYFGLANYPKIMGFARLFWAFVGGAGAPLSGFIRESRGSYLPAFQLAIAALAIGLACLVFAKPPVHPSLKKPKPVEEYSHAV